MKLDSNTAARQEDHESSNETRRRRLSYPDPMGETVAALDVMNESAAELERMVSLGTRIAAEARERLREVIRTKDEVLALASHDMRTPIACLHGALDLLEPTLHDLNDDQRHLLGIARRAADSIVLLVGNLVAITGVADERGDDLPGTDVGRLATEIMDLMSVLARRRDVSLTLEDAAPPCALAGDPLFVRQLVANLVGLAVRASRVGGSVILRLSAMGASEVRLCVDTDTDGDALPPNVVEEILHRRRSPDLGGRQRSEGLSLFVVGELVCRLGGSIHACATQEGRRLVTVRLPTAAGRLASPR